MSWTEGDPGAGDVQGLRSAASTLGTAAQSLSDVHFDLRSHSGTLTDEAWGGVAGDAWRVSASTCTDNVSGLIEATTSGGAALVAYAELVEQIAQEAVQARQQKQDAAADLVAATLMWAPPPPRRGQTLVLTASEKARQERARVEAKRDAQVAVGAADRAMAELVERRRAADAQVRAALGVVAVGDWRAVGKASVAAGITSPSGVGGSGTSQALVSLAQDVLDGNASMDDLMRLLQAWGGDEEVLSRFFRSLGGSATVALVDALSGQAYGGEIGEDVARKRAEALLSAMSLASASWTPGQARRFTEQMVDHGPLPSALGFLFCSAETSSMGKNLTLAVADYLDSFERVNGIWSRWDDAGGHVLANLLFPDRPRRGGDAMSGVLETLGVYPEAALDWLVHGAGDQTAPRINYWVGQRNWSSDGFLGVSSLWSGLQQQAGGPLDVERYDPRVWARLAQANAAFGRGLEGNPFALPEHFTVEAQVRLATALGQMMPLLAYAVRDDPSRNDPLCGEVSMFVWDAGGAVGYEVRVVPVLDRSQIARLFGLAASSKEGAEVLMVGVRHAQQALLNAALVSPGYDPDAGLRLVADMQAILDGSLVGSVEGISQRAAERAELLVSAATELIANLPFPGSTRVAGQLGGLGREVLGDSLARWVAEKAVGRVTDAAREAAAAAVQGWMTDAMTDQALAGTWVGGGERDSEDYRLSLRASLQKLLDDWILILQDGGADPMTDFAERVNETSTSLTGSYGAIYGESLRAAKE